MKTQNKSMIHRICIEICDGDNSKCQRYPRLSETCERFVELKKAYELGLKDNKKSKV